MATYRPATATERTKERELKLAISPALRRPSRALIPVGAACCLFLSGCGKPKQETGGKITLKFVSWMLGEKAAGGIEPINRAIAAFEKTHPNIVIEGEGLPYE